MIYHNKKQNNGGFAILYAVLVASVVAIGGLILSNIIFKQLVLSGVGQSSQIAYYAADVGRACAAYWRTQNSFGYIDEVYDETTGEVSEVNFVKSGLDPTIGCINDNKDINLEEANGAGIESGTWEFFIRNINNNSCAKISVTNGIEEFRSTSIGYNNSTCVSNNRLVLRRVEDFVSGGR